MTVLPPSLSVRVLRLLTVGLVGALTILAAAPLVQGDPFWKPISATLAGETFTFSSVEERDHFNAQVRAGGDVIYMPSPHYPTRARWFRREGACTVRLTFPKLGKPSAVQVLKSSGFKILDETLKDQALSRWRLVRRAGGGFPATGNITVSFTTTSDGGSG